MTFGPDLHIGYLPFYARCQLAYMLDEPGRPGQDWAALATRLELSNEDVARVRAPSPEQAQSMSKTDTVLSLWARYRPSATLRLLRAEADGRGPDRRGGCRRPPRPPPSTATIRRRAAGSLGIPVVGNPSFPKQGSSVA